MISIGSCSNASKAESEPSPEALYKTCQQAIINFKMHGDQASLDTAVTAAEKLLQIPRAASAGYLTKMQVLVLRNQYDDAKQLVVDNQVGKFMIPEFAFQDYSSVLAENIEALKADHNHDAEAMKEHVANAEKLLRDEVYSTRFNLTDFCKNTEDYSQQAIFKMLVLQQWCDVMAFLGGNERVKSELKKIIDNYQAADHPYLMQLYNTDYSMHPKRVGDLINGLFN